MTKLLITALAVAFIGGCVITPPGSLQAERERHAKEMQALEYQKDRITLQLDDTQESLEACEADLAAEREHRTDARAALAYVRWCDAIGSTFGLCRDELYNDGLTAYQDGERVDSMRLLALWGWTLLEVAGGICLVITIPLILWLQARRDGVLMTRKEAEHAKHRLEVLRDQCDKQKEEKNGLLGELEQIRGAREYSINQLRRLYGKIKRSRDELEKIERTKDMLDI